MVEDDRGTSHALRAIFQRRGWDVLLAWTVGDALPLLGTMPDCVILDLMLPDGDGLRVLEHIRAEALPIRVAVTTGSHDPALWQAVTDLQPDVFLTKPINLKELLRGLEVDP